MASMILFMFVFVENGDSEI